MGHRPNTPPERIRDRRVRQEERDDAHKLTTLGGIAALSLDALSSVAYGPEAIVLALVAAGAAAVREVVPVSVAIVILLLVLVLSYRQVIAVYPDGGGAYAVAKKNLGPRTSLLAAASLVVDYVLTVAVSLAAGAASLGSVFPSLSHNLLAVSLIGLAVLTVLNLIGIAESAKVLMLPTIVFVIAIAATIGVGLARDHPVKTIGQDLGPIHATEALGIVVLLKAFAAGCSALTGVEAIANGVPQFREPRVKRAKRTEALLGTILGVMLLGLAVLADRWHIGPRSGQTVLSQIMAMAVGRNWAYYVMSLTITLVLALAANTSFGGLPVLASLLAKDHYLPHLFSLRDDRQVFAPGIWTLSLASAVLLIAVRGNVLTLIPLFAIGVFTGFTLSQSGLVVHWRRNRPPRWEFKAAVNGLGAAATAVATAVFILTKFTEGAWVVVIAVPAFIFLFTRIHRYYRRVGLALGLGEIPGRPEVRPIMVVVLVAGVSRLAQYAVGEALSISEHVIAVTVVLEDADGSTGQGH